jgi:hypothetical protein
MIFMLILRKFLHFIFELIYIYIFSNIKQLGSSSLTNKVMMYYFPCRGFYRCSVFCIIFEFFIVVSILYLIAILGIYWTEVLFLS